MWTRHHKNRNTGRLIIPGVSALFLAYFGFHAYHGEFGIYSKYQLEARTAELKSELGQGQGAAHRTRAAGAASA